MIDAKAVAWVAAIGWTSVAMADRAATEPTAASTEPTAVMAEPGASATEPNATATESSAAPASGAKADASAEDILNGTAPPANYSQAVKCLRSELIERTEPLSDRYIVFHLRGNQIWIAQLRNRCPQMNYDSKLVFVKNNPRICEWDSVRVVLDSGMVGTDDLADYRLGPPCNLPKFEPITQDQVNLLKQSLQHKAPKTQ